MLNTISPETLQLLKTVGVLRLLLKADQQIKEMVI